MTLFAELAGLLDRLAREGSRLKKRAAIAEAIRTVHAASPGAEDAGLFAMYLAGMPFAEWDGRKLNAGGALLTRAVRSISGADEAQLAAAYRQHGDLGAAAFDLLEGKAHEVQSTLTLAEIAEAFAAMAAARTTAVRAALVEGLLRRAAPVEAKFLLKLMLGDMRTGVKQSLVEEAIAVAAEAPVVDVRHAVMLEADLASAVTRAFAGSLGEAQMRLFHPLGFMLASPVETPEEAVERFTKGQAKGTDALDASTEDAGLHAEALAPEREPAPQIEAFLEDKYDGMRAQMHFGDPGSPGRVAIYSRNREDITESYPELAEAFAAASAQGVGATVLDGEILGWNFGAGVEDESGAATVEDRSLYSGRALPFAVLGQRIGRKRVSNEWRTRVPVVFMAFDLMVEQGELVLACPLRERRNRLEAIAERIATYAVSPLDDEKASAQTGLFAEEAVARELVPRLLLSPARLVESAEDIDRAYAAARARSNEGVMIKAADSAYQAGRRGLAWVKLKRELATLDVVITGAEYGHGRRAGTLSDYTFAVRGPGFARTGELLNVGKAYSGVTDVEIAELTEFLKAHTLEDHGHFRTVEPLLVLEVAFNNIMRSERHASGFALRFPRILRLRPDKPVAEIDTLARVEEVYQSQVDKPMEE